MVIWFECKTENLMIGLDTDTKPSVGDTVKVEDKEYTVEKVIWCLERPPFPSELLIQVNKSKMHNAREDNYNENKIG